VLVGDTVPIQIMDPHFAVGSGGPYAKAKMAMGGSARTAVAFASQFDVNTNDEVEWVEIHKA
jgi:ATP-dependent protease HslVU (ClpYQ) peptidase subunit